jgi:hypothetical protein
MKKLFLLFFLAVFSFNGNAQCVKLYITDHISGSPICNLSEGDYIQVCEDLNEVRGCPRNLYIYQKGSSMGSLTYNLSLDKGWSTHYAKLYVNPTTKKLGFEIQGQTGVYGYITESEMNAVLEKNKIESQKILEIDKATYPSINAALNKGNYNAALTMINKLKFPYSYPRYNEFVDLKKSVLILEDKKIFIKIDSLLTFSKEKEAADLFSDINYPNEILAEEIKKKVELSLIASLKRDSIFTKVELNQLESFLAKNISNLSLKLGVNEFQLNENGQVFQNGNTTSVFYSTDYLFFGKSQEFKVPIPISKLNFTLKKEQAPMKLLSDKRDWWEVKDAKGAFYLVEDKDGIEKCYFLSHTTFSLSPSKKYPKIKHQITNYEFTRENFQNVYSTFCETDERAKILYYDFVYLNDKEIYKAEAFSKYYCIVYR